MHILIVDDEYFACAALEKLVKEYFQQHDLPLLCRIFNSAKEALEYLYENKVDLIMTDIRMSEIDGLELALRVQKIDHDIETVVISGYADFGYAQTALKYEVVDYLLKPISRKQIYSCLDERVKSYEKRCESKERERMYRDNTVFYQIVHNEDFCVDDLPESSQKECFEQVVMVMIMGKDLHLRLDKEKIAVTERMKDIFGLNIGNLEDTMILFIYFSIRNGVGNLQERVVRQYRTLYKREWLEERDILITVSSEVDISVSFHCLYNQCKYALKGKLLNPDQYLFDYKELTDEKKIDRTSTMTLEFELRQSFEFRNMALTKDIIQRWIDKIMETKHVSLPHFLDNISWIGIMINKIIFDHNNKAEQQIAYISEAELAQCETVEEIRAFFSAQVERIYLEMNAKDASWNIVERMLQYVEDNYFSDISLAGLSQNILYMNPSYLSRLFKSQTGVSFSTYLLNFRLEKAMEDICGNSKMSIQEVAALTGFNDCSYFVKQFRKKYGETPGYYQKQHKKN